MIKNILKPFGKVVVNILVTQQLSKCCDLLRESGRYWGNELNRWIGSNHSGRMLTGLNSHWVTSLEANNQITLLGSQSGSWVAPEPQKPLQLSSVEKLASFFSRAKCPELKIFKLFSRGAPTLQTGLQYSLIATVGAETSRQVQHEPVQLHL